MLIKKSFLMENKRFYVMFSTLCILLFILLYLVSTVLGAFTVVDDVKVEQETQVYLQQLKDSVILPKDDISNLKGEGTIKRDGEVCNAEEYRGRLKIGCPVLIPDADYYGDRYNPFDTTF